MVRVLLVCFYGLVMVFAAVYWMCLGTEILIMVLPCGIRKRKERQGKPRQSIPPLIVEFGVWHLQCFAVDTHPEHFVNYQACSNQGQPESQFNCGM